ncbi:hypothetical protein CK203_020607 [Vitis vinifera]|uniref:Uncharacterized protein n=1 Tax=Vitis vinifera TaxID=29760 RepID=A0A438FMG2_VITVI|nr:hypothetical protein CK203_020607 [Vitis vinifera]
MSSPPRVLPEFFKVYLPEYSSDRLEMTAVIFIDIRLNSGTNKKERKVKKKNG